ncbi:MAG: endolytic transglycosylase MltG [Clostridia bacterium]|nr:endolytic transglycosylase MltG [Clostridia bacterium]
MQLINDTELQNKKNSSIIKALRTLSIYLVSICIVVGLIIGVAITSYNKLMSPVDPMNKNDIEINIPKGASTSSIAQLLEKKGLIKNSSIFKLYVDFSNNGANMKAGKYKLNTGMTMQEVMDELVTGNAKIKTLKVTIKEGMNINEVASVLEQKGVIEDDKAFNRVIEQGSFNEYLFIKDNVPYDRPNFLEGYLFPDTYEFYADSDPDIIVYKMLDNFESKLFDDGQLKQKYAEKLSQYKKDGYIKSLDDIITLASIIEKESKQEEFAKVSAVFHNRLKKDQALQSCATIQYILDREVNSLIITNEDQQKDSPYNTYKNKGLPIGPISNPGLDAIDAAFFPDEQYLEQEYMYFVLKNPETGEQDFSKTYEEHSKKVKKYREQWK